MSFRARALDRAAMPLYDLVLVNDYYHGIQLALSWALGRMECLPISACDPDFHHPYDLSDAERAAYTCDIAFVGTLVPDHLYSRRIRRSGAARFRPRHLERPRRAVQPAPVRARASARRGHAQNHLGGEAVHQPTAISCDMAAICVCSKRRARASARSATICRGRGNGSWKSTAPTIILYNNADDLRQRSPTT
ncbi:MAG: hypothetical protein U0703_23005 [Anaerolineae bacterium]